MSIQFLFNRRSFLVLAVGGLFVLSAALPSTTAQSPEPGVKCKLGVPEPAFSRNLPVVISVCFENKLTEPVVIQGFPAFYLVDIASESTAGNESWKITEYYCPVKLKSYEPRGLVDIEPIGNSGWISGKVDTAELTIPPGAVLELAYDLSQLNWALTKSSTWPNRKLFAVVEPGEYWLEFQVRNNDGVKSQRERVSLK